MPTINIDINQIVSRAYYPLFASRARYIAYKGSRGSGKSYAAAEKVIMDTIRYPYVNWLVMRQYFGTHKDSTYSTIKRVAYSMGVENLFKFTVSPLEVTYWPTGQKIFFRGMDDPLKVTSIQTQTGNLCRAWWEEAYQLKSLNDFKTVEESMRGEMVDPNGFYQSILTFNPWSDRHWLKAEFFDPETREQRAQAYTTTYKDNDHLDPDYVAMLREMVTRNPNRARVAVFGDWGIAEGLIFEGLFEERPVDPEEIVGLPKGVGLDFGFKHDPTAGEYFAIDTKQRLVYVFDEFYQQGMLTQQIARALIEHGSMGKHIVADSAEQRLITELSLMGVPDISPAGKGKDSVTQGIQYMQSYKYVIDPRCKGLLEEMNTYVYDQDKQGNWLNTPVDANNHGVDALRYGMEPYMFQRAGKYMNYQDRVRTVKNLGL